MKLETTNKKKCPCEYCADGIYMTVEKEWWCDKHLMYACQMEKNRLCEKFERDGEQADGNRQAVLDMATVIETDDYSGNEIMEVVDTDDIKALPSVTPASKPEQSCEDAISRKEMLDYQEYLHGKMSNEENYKLWEFIKALPSVTPVSKKSERAHWIDNHNGTISCGCCHAWFHKDDRYSYMRYCPNCGEKMEAEKNE